jgi:hypothetical protein
VWAPDGVTTIVSNSIADLHDPLQINNDVHHCCEQETLQDVASRGGFIERFLDWCEYR